MMSKKEILKNCIKASKQVVSLNNQVCSVFQCDDWDELFKVVDSILDIATSTLEINDKYEKDDFTEKFFAIIFDDQNEFEDIEKALVYLLLED